ncbi:hypothetical protein NDA10_003231 [Ustilago hordei]|nr:hypothetical protein NDA10_003231 [Ustilago hordei]
MEIFILEAEAWFKFNQVYEQSRMINHMGAQLEGTAREWWTSKLRIDRAREGRLFNDWHYFTERLSEQFNPRNARMEAYNKLLALRLTSDTPGAATRHVERFRDLEGQVNLDDNELVIDLFRGSLTRSIQEKFERNPPGKRWEWYREVEEIDQQRMLLQQSSARHSLPNATSPPLRTGSRPNQSSIPIRQPTQTYPARSPSQATTQATIQNLNRPFLIIPPNPRSKEALLHQLSTHGTKGYGHHSRPFEEATDSGDGHTGSTETGDPEAMDLSSYQQPMDPDHEEEHNDDDDEGNVSKALIPVLVFLRACRYLLETPEAARAGDLTMRRPTLHGNEFVSAERILRAALEDGPIGFMLLEEPPSSLPAFGFVPTGADKGVEMEVEVDKVVTAADIPKPYQHLRDVFDEVEADKLPHHTEHDLHLELIEGGKPPQGPLYLKGPKEMSELRRYLDENLEKGFIRPSKSLARSPVLFVPKKDGGLRLCVDYRGLNEITVKNRAPLPLIEEQLFLLRKARIYTKLDLRAAYNLIRIAKGDEWKTAFGTQLGLYEYLVMPFGLANAPAHFQSFINDIFRDIIGIYVVVYLDDFLIFSDTEEAHVKHVTEVLTRLRSNRLFAKLSKCEFHTKTVEFLGYIIKPTGIEMDPEKVRTVKEWPMLESIHDIQRFLGFANFYRRFIAHFARIAKPLTALVKPIERFKKFELPEEAQQAFHKLIQAFTSAGVLQHFDYHLPTRLRLMQVTLL